MEALAEAENNIPAELALLMGNTIRQQDLELLREVIRQIAVTCEDNQARWMFRTVRLDLSQDQQTWFDEAIAQIRNPEE